MVILSRPYGGLSNRLFQHIHFDAFCRDSGVEFINGFLQANRGRALLKRAANRARIAFGVAPVLYFNKEGADYSFHEQAMRSEPIVFVEGWAFRNNERTSRYRDFYRRHFYGEVVVQLDPDKPNLAIHIRRGDYKGWQNGRFYFTDSVYFSIIDRVLDMIGKNTRVLLFSDDRSLAVRAYQSRYGAIYSIRSTPQNDHLLMSACDYIVGPPSTFSMWASYIGARKFCHIRSVEDEISEASFSVCNG